MNDLLPSLKASLATLLVLCGACSPVPQKPLSSGMVRVNLAADVGNDVRAYRVDGELTHSIRFDDLTPGAERRGWVSVGGLYDQQTQKKVASAEEVRCGPGL